MKCVEAQAGIIHNLPLEYEVPFDAGDIFKCYEHDVVVLGNSGLCVVPLCYDDWC